MMINYTDVFSRANELNKKFSPIPYASCRSLDIVRNKRVLHFGSGALDKPNHQDIKALASDVIAVDSDPLSNAHYASMDYVDGKFDLVFSEHTIEHISIDDLYHVIMSFMRLLKQGGDVLITIPNIHNFGSWFSHYDHKNFAPPLHIAAIFECAGLILQQVYMWSKHSHVTRHANFDATEQYIASFLEREYGLMLARYVTMHFKKC